MPLFAKQGEKGETNAVFLRKKRKWPYAAAAAATFCLVVVLAGKAAGGDAVPTISPTDTSRLVQCDLQDRISATGTVESARSMTVYSTMAYTVQEVCVEVGDRVEEGQLLCRLDDRNLLDQIETQEASIQDSSSVGSASIASARDNYEQFKSNLENGLNTSIISAENAVTNAYNAYVAAQNNYDRYLAGLEAGENTALLTQESALRNARKGVENANDSYEDALEALEEAEEALEDAEDGAADAEKAYKAAKKALSQHRNELADLELAAAELQQRETALGQQLDASSDDSEKALLQAQLAEVQEQLAQQNAQRLELELQGSRLESTYSAAQSALTQAEALLTQAEQACELAEKQADACADAVDTAREAYETAQKQYNAALTSADNALADYAKNAETAFQSYQTAQTSLQAARTAAQNQLQVYKNNLNSAYANANRSTAEVSLRQLRADLDSTRITAPTAGTVTAVYAQVGSSGSGLLFVIEDTENFVVTTSVKDYDITTVTVGTAATIQSDATGDDLYEGEVTSIAPAANKNAMGGTDTGGDVSFAADVAVRSTDTRLRIGLSVRLNFIVAEEKNALAAPYDAVYENAQGQTCILAALEQDDGTWLLQETPVTCGLETDLEVAVKGDGLTAGTTVVSDPEPYVAYIGKPVRIGLGGSRGSASAMLPKLPGES